MRFFKKNKTENAVNASKVDNSKTQYRLFLKKDIIIYILLVLFVFALFCTFVIPQSCSSKKNSDGFKVTVNNSTIISHNYGTTEFNVSQSWKNRIHITKEEDNFLIKIVFEDSYNLIFCDEQNRSVKMRDSTCSLSADCKYLPAVYNNGTIYCAPHNLKISTLLESGKTPPITG